MRWSKHGNGHGKTIARGQQSSFLSQFWTEYKLRGNRAAPNIQYLWQYWQSASEMFFKFRAYGEYFSRELRIARQEHRTSDEPNYSSAHALNVCRFIRAYMCYHHVHSGSIRRTARIFGVFLCIGPVFENIKWRCGSRILYLLDLKTLLWPVIASSQRPTNLKLYVRSS